MPPKLHAGIGAIAWVMPKQEQGHTEKHRMDGHFRRGGELAPTVQFRRQQAKEKVGDIINMEPEDGTLGPAIVPCVLQKAKSFHGSNSNTKK
eukprot:scaffold129611_cov55-Attheya_sp.AAC.1